MNYILFTYRQNILPLLPTTYYSSDQGWGCMLRVAQMFIAHFYKKILLRNDLDIIRLFLDNSTAGYSIQCLTEISSKIYSKPNFDWYNPNEVGFIVKQLIERQEQSVRVSIFPNLCMFQSQILQDRENCIVMLMCRIGLEYSETQYLQTLIRMMQTKYFTGVLGGQARHAHFILEADLEKIRFLDPHTTHSVIKNEEDLENRINQFQKYNLEQVSIEKLDPSFCITFSFKASQIMQFWNEQLKLKQQLKQKYFIYLAEKNEFQYIEGGIVEISDDD